MSFGQLAIICPACGEKFYLSNDKHEFEVKKYMNAPTEYIVRCLKS